MKIGRGCRLCIHSHQGLHLLKARDGGKLSFRDLLGVHDLWKEYAARIVSQCGSNQKQLQQRILSADLQVCAKVQRVVRPTFFRLAIWRSTAAVTMILSEGRHVCHTADNCNAIFLEYNVLVLGCSAPVARSF